MLSLRALCCIVFALSHQTLSMTLSRNEDSISLMKRTVPQETWAVKDYEISARKWADKVAMRKAERPYDGDRVERAQKKLDMVDELDQQNINKAVGKYMDKVQQIENKMTSLSQQQDKIGGKFVAFSYLHGRLGEMARDWKFYESMEQMKRQYPDNYEDMDEFWEVEQPQGFPQVTLQEIENYFPCGVMQDSKDAMWQMRILQAAKISGESPHHFDLFASKALIDHYSNMMVRTETDDQDYQIALAEFDAVINLDRKKAQKASDLNGYINGRLNRAICNLKAPLKYYQGKLEAWSKLSAKRTRRLKGCIKRYVN